MVWLCLWLVYLGSSSSDQAVRIKIQGQKWGKDSQYQHHGKCSRHGGNHSNSGW